MRKYLQYLLLTACISMLLSTNVMAADAVEPKASGIKNNIINYELSWCPAHISIQSSCYVGKFQKQSANSALLGVQGVDTSSLIDIFQNGITSFLFQAEGRISIKVWGQDNAENLTVKKITYLIDKTAPQLGEINFSETSPYISVEDSGNKIYQVKVKNAISQYFGFNEFPLLAKYIDNPITTQKDIADMKTIRFKISNVPTNDTLTINLPNLTDSGDKLSRGNVSGLQKVELIKNGSDILTTFSNVSEGNTTFTIQPKLLFSGIPQNTGAYINLRSYDLAGNYSDHVFYAFRDETVPLVNDMNFTFKGSSYDITNQGKGLSHFALATQNAKINYEWGPENDHMAKITMEVEDNANKDNINNYILSTDNTNTHTTRDIDISNIDADLLNTSVGKNFREYGVRFNTPGINGNRVCDSVGNCVGGENILSQIRAIAGDLSIEQSYAQVNTPEKAFADGTSKYNFIFSLEDKFGNKIREITNSGDGTIKTNSFTIDFDNNLTKSTTNQFSNTITNPIIVSGDEINTNNINASNSQIIFKEPIASSNGEIDFDISSIMPTYNGYKFLKNDTFFKFKKLTTQINYNQQITFDFESTSVANNESNSTNFGDTNKITILGDLKELKTFKYNMSISSNYGKITNNFGNTFFKSLNNSGLELEFSSPVVYHASDFNILRDGIDSVHTKQVEKYASTVTNLELNEKYFDIDSPDSTSDKVDFYVADQRKNDFNEYVLNDNQPSKVRYEAKQGEDFTKWGYVSYISYNIGSQNITLPAISRGIKTNSADREASAAYFPSIVYDENAGISFLTNDVAIDGLVNNIDGGATSDVEDQSGLVSLDLERPYTRAGLLENVKKKIFEINNNQDRWCEDSSIDTSFNNSDCTFTFQGEEIVFIKGNLEISGGEVSGKKSIIVTDGSIEITGNITTKNSNGQLFLASISNKGLENVHLDDSSIITDDNKHGWISIDESVTNIDAFILAQGPLVSTNGGNIITNYQRDDQLLNQLHIYGSVFSLNTIGGAKTLKCPYIETNCDDNNMKSYDLSFLRRYTLVDGESIGYTGYKVPYGPNYATEFVVRSSGGCNYFDDIDANANSAKNCDSDLRIPEKEKHWYAPVIIQRDQRWSMNPTYFSKED